MNFSVEQRLEAIAIKLRIMRKHVLAHGGIDPKNARHVANQAAEIVQVAARLFGEAQTVTARSAPVESEDGHASREHGANVELAVLRALGLT
jgi:hypothetical protein